MAFEQDMPDVASGETFRVAGVIADQNGTPMAITGAKVSLLYHQEGVPVATFTTDEPPGSIINGDEGLYLFLINRDDQVAARLGPGRYGYTIWCEWPDEQESEQTIGTVVIKSGPKQVVLP